MKNIEKLPTKFSPKIKDDYPEVHKQFLEFKAYISKLTSYDSLPLAVSYPNNPKICYQSFPELDPEGHVTPYYFEQVGQLDALWRVFSILYVRNTAKGMCNSIAVNEFFNERRARAEVSRIRAFVVDIDSFVGEEDFKKLVAAIPEPSFVVRSSWKKGEGSKFHLYWLVRAPEKGNDYEEGFSRRLVGKYEEINKALAYKVEGVGQSLGLTVVADKSIGSEKVLRAPGFYHQKNGEKDFLVKLEQLEGEELGEDDLVVIECSKKSIDSFLLEFGIDKEFLAWAEKQQSERHERLKTKGGQVSLLKNAGELASNIPSSYYTKDEVEVGERNESLFFIVGDMLKRGLSFEECLGGALVYNEGLENPLPPEEVERLVISRIKLWEKSKSASSEEILKEKLKSTTVSEGGKEECGSEEGVSGSEGKDYLTVHYDYNNFKYFDAPLSELSIAERVKQRYPDRIFSPNTISKNQHSLYIYDEHRGLFTTNPGKIRNAFNEVITDMWRERLVFEHDKFAKKEKGIRVDTNLPKLENFIEKKKSDASLSSLERTLTCHDDIIIDLDEFDNELELLLCGDCVVNLNTGEKLEFNPKYKMLSGIKTKFNTELYEKEKELWENESLAKEVFSRCSSPWKKFLWEVFEGEMDMIRYIQQILAYGLSGSLDKQSVFFFYGDGRNGKSTLLQTYFKMLGDMGLSGVKKQLVTDSSWASSDNAYYSTLARLVGKRGCLVNEIQLKDVLLTNSIKNLSEGHLTEARKLGKDAFDYQVQFTIFLYGNHKPRVDDTSFGIWRRLKCVPFEREFLSSEVDENLMSKLNCEEVYEEILAMCVAAYPSLGKIVGFSEPEKCRVFGEDYRRESHPLSWFLDKHYENYTHGTAQLIHDNKAGGTKVSEVWELYEQSYDRTHPSFERIQNVTKFGIEMKKLGIKKYRNTHGVHYALVPKDKDKRKSIKQSLQEHLSDKDSL